MRFMAEKRRKRRRKRGLGGRGKRDSDAVFLGCEGRGRRRIRQLSSPKYARECSSDLPQPTLLATYHSTEEVNSSPEAGGG